MENVPPYIIESYGSTRQGTSQGVPGGWELNFHERNLTFIRIDHQTRLQFGPTEVVVESPFVLTVGGAELRLDPGERGNLGELLALYPDTLGSASIDAHATLTLRFESGATIVVSSDPQYEAWQINGPGNFLVVCAPGTSGKLAIWK